LSRATQTGLLKTRVFNRIEFFVHTSLTMVNGHVDVRKGSGRTAAGESVTIDPLPKERSSPLAYMANAIQTHQPPEGLVALDINVQVVEIIDAARQSIKLGRVVPLR
jgi:hypothetical protein